MHPTEEYSVWGRMGSISTELLQEEPAELRQFWEQSVKDGSWRSGEGGFILVV